MRKFGTLILAIAALAFAGGIATAQTPKKGGELVFAISAETPHYDPHASDTYATLHFAGAVLFDIAAFQSRRNFPSSKAISPSPGPSRRT